MPTIYKSPLAQAKSELYPKPERNDEFYLNAYKDGYKINPNNSKEARLGKGRLNYLISEYGVWDDDSNYSNAYLAYIDPREFIKGTTIKGGTTEKELANQPLLDLDRVNNEFQTPFLDVDFEGNIIKGHEGRHRLQSFANSGIERLPIVIRDRSPNFRKNKALKRNYNGSLGGQYFGGIGLAENALLNSDLIPINYKNIEDLYKIFGLD